MRSRAKELRASETEIRTETRILAKDRDANERDGNKSERQRRERERWRYSRKTEMRAKESEI